MLEPETQSDQDLFPQGFVELDFHFSTSCKFLSGLKEGKNDK